MSVPLPEEDLRTRLAGRPGCGTYEAHVTVEATSPEAIDRFRTLCADLGVKCVVIELPTGNNPTQPMTASYHRGPLEAVVEEVAGLAARVRSGGFSVVRVKLEAVATNDGVPVTDEEARACPPICYFEFHVKLVLPADTDLGPVRELCAGHGARLSSNALKARADGRAERFVTLRVYRAGRGRAFAAFDQLCADLEAAGLVVANRLREYSLYDSREALDAGWLDRPPT